MVGKNPPNRALSHLSVTVAVLLHAGVPPCDGQAIRVGLSVTEDTGGLFQSAFATALRSLPDVSVVTRQEHPRIFVQVVVLCTPDKDCDSATSYSVAIALSEPLDSANATATIDLANKGLPQMLRLSEGQTRILAVQTLSIMNNYEIPLQLSVATWGRNVYPRAISEFMAKFDSKCLERQRIRQRMMSLYESGDTAGSNALASRWADVSNQEHWMC